MDGERESKESVLSAWLNVYNDWYRKLESPDFMGQDKKKKGKLNKLAEFHVNWLDLENSFVRHVLIEKAMEFFWIWEVVKKLISVYFKCTHMKFSKWDIPLYGKD